jgi:hypothetical protein
MYPVSDMYLIWVRYAPDTPAAILEYPDNFDTSRYILIRSDTPQYASVTPPIRSWYFFFQGILVDSVKNTPPVLVDMPQYSSDTSLSEIYIMSFVLL